MKTEFYAWFFRSWPLEGIIYPCGNLDLRVMVWRLSLSKPLNHVAVLLACCPASSGWGCFGCLKFSFSILVLRKKKNLRKCPFKENSALSSTLWLFQTQFWLHLLHLQHELFSETSFKVKIPLIPPVFKSYIQWWKESVSAMPEKFYFPKINSNIVYYIFHFYRYHYSFKHYKQ